MIDSVLWNTFVKNHRNGNIFHTSLFAEFYSVALGYEVISAFLIDENDTLDGLILAVINKKQNSFVNYFTSRAIVSGGLLARDNLSSIIEILLNSINRQLKGKIVYVEIRNLNDNVINKSFFQSAGYFYRDHIDILIDLRKEEKELWDGMHPTRRKQIRRAKKRGVTTRIGIPDEKEVLYCYKLLAEVYKNAGVPLPCVDFFQKAILHLSVSNNLNCITAFAGGQIIGFRLFLLYNGLIYDWYAASDPVHYDKYPNDILPWDMIIWAKNNGYSVFDFGGAGNPNENYGVRDYKLKFGGTVHNFGRFIKVFRPGVFLVASFFYRNWIKYKSL